ncbi:MAG: HAMP domain-containing histidine kinase [Myxococcales bacterium FL481]|nr:MAG: HAMP domain-containing histidine kinase [Myxococcales bacterium FL481]
MARSGGSDDDQRDAPPQLASPAAEAGVDLPPLRLRYSLPVRVVAFVFVLMLATLGAAAVMVAQSRTLTASDDLLTGVYVPLQERLTAAHVQAARIRAQVSREDVASFRGGDLLNFVEAMRRRTELVVHARELIEPAFVGSRAMDEAHRARLQDLATELAELEQLVRADAESDLVGDDLDVGAGAENVEDDELGAVTRTSALVRRQHAIDRKLRSLQDKGRAAVIAQRTEVAHARERAEQLVVVVSFAAAAFGLLAVLGAFWTMRPLRRLSERARRLGAGHWDEPIEPGGSLERDDEVSRLAREFDMMAAALSERERRLIRTERLAAVGQLASQITHEIRNPLSSVALNAELLADEMGASSPEARQLLTRIVDEVDRLATVTEDYLRLARRPKPALVPLDLCDELRDLEAFLASEHAEAGVDIGYLLPSDGAWVLGDPDQLRQVFLNLLRNAQEAVLEAVVADPAASRQPRIEVRLQRKGDSVLVVVADNGAGIALPAGEWDRVFEAFFTQKPHGTGLGLPMVHEIVQDHGGRVGVLASGPSGTQFEVELSACDRPERSVSSGPLSS